MKPHQTLQKIISHQNLSTSEAEAFINLVLNGSVASEQLAAFLACMKMKGETPDEILGCVLAMRQKMKRLESIEGAIDVCGTGGDQSGTFNISTTVAFVAAGAGAKVAKHGNRAATSLSGSADVLEALGVNIHLSPEQATDVLNKTGIVFLFAPDYHPAMKHVAPIRKALGIPTLFNLLGPFSNPAGVQSQLVGVPDMQNANMLASVVKQLPHRRVLIVSSHDKLDEISIAAPSTVLQIEAGAIVEKQIKPSDFGFEVSSLDNLKGGTAAENADIVRDILNGAQGPKRNIVVLNAAYALYAANIVATPQEGIERAIAAIDQGSAKRALEQLIKETNHYA